MRALFLLLASCASLSLQYGETSPHDTDCGAVGGVSVHLHPGYFWSCEESRTFVANGLEAVPLSREWTAVLGLEPAGWEPVFNAPISVVPGSIPQTIRYTSGATYPATRVIALRGMDSRALLHELGHAQDFERGLASRRDW